MKNHPLDYDPKQLPRELHPYYIAMTSDERKEILRQLNLNSLDDLYRHIDKSVRMPSDKYLVEGLEYDALVTHMNLLAAKNHLYPSFLGGALPVVSRPDTLLAKICAIRGLTTAYTPYQPERSQGTLMSLWVYCSLLSELTGFEAINASLYDRSTALVESLLCAQRLQKSNMPMALVSAGIEARDLEVLCTHLQGRDLQYRLIPIDPATGRTSLEALSALGQEYAGKICGVAFQQVNTFGVVEPVDELTDMIHALGAKAVAIVDPVHLAPGFLKAPSEYGKEKKGADIFIAEGQHLALPPIFGGPGVGIFGMRYNDEDRQSIRAMPGRLLSMGKDNKGRDALVLVLSTREQHIRREKATSNICSNQSFVATLVGASLLARGADGLTRIVEKSLQNRNIFLAALSSIKGLTLAFKTSEFVLNEVLLKVEGGREKVQELIDLASEKFQLHLGVACQQYLKLSFNDVQSADDVAHLIQFLQQNLGREEKSQEFAPPALHSTLLRTQKAPGFLAIAEDKILAWYQMLGELNVTPDDSIYALGSCTMKYNPYINDYAANLPGFKFLHPEVPEQDAQGSLELLFEIQEMFKRITGLAAVTTQPVAGAQGELVGIKMFQAYFRHRGEEGTRQVMIIPKTAHGTNPATASVAGLEASNLVTLEANHQGQIDFDHLKRLVAEYGTRIMGVMVTNPNTSGIFETEFKAMSELIHSVGGLVYMDGANMNAIAGIVDLNALGVDAVHNNLHKTWSIPHGGGGPGDGIVAVSSRLVDFLPGVQVVREGGMFKTQKAKHSLGEFHRHFGNFGHKVRCYTYLKALGSEGIRLMSETAVLSARYLNHHLSQGFPILPENTLQVPRMHEFILTLSREQFVHVEAGGVPRAKIIAQIGKLFLDFGLHAPTVAFPEVFGLMIEPTESYSLQELDHFIAVVKCIGRLLEEHPSVLKSAPHFTPVDRIDEVAANKNPQFCGLIRQLPILPVNRVAPRRLQKMQVEEIYRMIVESHVGGS